MKPGDHPDFFRFPAPLGHSRESTIRLDRNGHFWHDGQRVEHPKLIQALHRWISRHPDDGRYILTNGYDWTYFTVEDAPFQVRTVLYQDGILHLRLSNDGEVVPENLSVATDDSLYASFQLNQQRYEARFSSHAQAQLEPALKEQDGVIGVLHDGHFLVPIPRSS